MWKYEFPQESTFASFSLNCSCNIGVANSSCERKDFILYKLMTNLVNELARNAS